MKKLSTEYYSIFSEMGHQYHLEPGEILYMQGDSASNLYLIGSGRVRMFYIGENGREITYRIIGEGQLLGEAAFLSHLQTASISAITATDLIVCPVQALYPYVEQTAGLSRMLFELLAENYTALSEQIKRLTIRDSEQRIMRFLLDLTKEDDANVGIFNHTLPYTQEELGVCLNLHRTTVARVLKKLVKEKLIGLGYKKIQVLDFEGLKQKLGE